MIGVSGILRHLTHVLCRCVEVVRFIKENSVAIFMQRIAVQEAGGGNGTTDENAIVSSPEDAMMGRMGILVVCRFERLLVEEQVRGVRSAMTNLRIGPAGKDTEIIHHFRRTWPKALDGSGCPTHLFREVTTFMSTLQPAYSSLD